MARRGGSARKGSQGIRGAGGKTSNNSDVISDRCDRMDMVCLLYPDDREGAGTGSYGVATFVRQPDPARWMFSQL